MTVPDHLLHLTQLGREQASESGRNLRKLIGNEGVSFVVSPYVRAVETLNGIAQAFGGKDKLNCREDPYTREQDFGNFDKPEAREYHKEKKIFGKFYYRFPEGESPADVYNRAGIFLETLYRRWETAYVDNQVIISHELFLVVFLMRMFRYQVQDYYSFEDLKNGQLIVLERSGDSLLYEITFTLAPWEAKKDGGLAMKSPSQDPSQQALVWDGDPTSPLLASTPSREVPTSKSK